MAVVAVIVTLFIVFQAYIVLKVVVKLNPGLIERPWFKWVKRLTYCIPVIGFIIFSIVVFFVKVIHLHFEPWSWEAILHSCVVIYVWTNATFNYFAAAVVKPGRPPKRDEVFNCGNQGQLAKSRDDNNDAVVGQNSISCSSESGLHFCVDCDRVLTYGAHHCKKCGDCIRMVCHHSWIANNCIGLMNFSYYFLFLVYGFIGLLYSLVMTYGPFHACYIHDHEKSKVSLEYPAMSEKVCSEIGELPLLFLIVLTATILEGGLFLLHCVLLRADLSLNSFTTYLKESHSTKATLKAVLSKCCKKQRRMKFMILLKSRKKSWRQFFYPSFNVLPLDLCYDDLFDEEQHYVQMV